MIGLVNLPKNTIDKGNTPNAIQEIAATNKILMTFYEIMVGIKFIAAVHTFWMFLYFDYLQQQGDWITYGNAGYQTP